MKAGRHLKQYPHGNISLVRYIDFGLCATEYRATKMHFEILRQKFAFFSQQHALTNIFIQSFPTTEKIFQYKCVLIKKVSFVMRNEHI